MRLQVFPVTVAFISLLLSVAQSELAGTLTRTLSQVFHKASPTEGAL